MLAKIDCERARSDVGLERRAKDSLTAWGSVRRLCQMRVIPAFLGMVSNLEECARRDFPAVVDNECAVRRERNREPEECTRSRSADNLAVMVDARPVTGAVESVRGFCHDAPQVCADQRHCGETFFRGHDAHIMLRDYSD